MRIQPSSPPASPAPPPPTPGATALVHPSGVSDQITPLTPSTPPAPSSIPARSPPAATLNPAPSNPLVDRIKSAQSSLANNPILQAISGGEEEEPDDTSTHRSVGVDPDFYDMVDDDIISILLDACKPLFDLVSSSSSPDSKNSTMKPADLLMSTAKLIIAAGFKMKEQARQEMAEEDLGGGMFDEVVREVRKAAASYTLPQVYETDEEETLNTQLAHHEAPDRSLKKYKTGTKLYTCEIADTGSGKKVRGRLEVRGPLEQVVAYWMGHISKYSNHGRSENEQPVTGERRNDHSVVVKVLVPMPTPFNDREVVARSLWKKLDENTYFMSQLSCEHTNFPIRADVVRFSMERTFKLTRIGPKMTLFEWAANLNLNGSIPRSVNDAVMVGKVVKSLINFAKFFSCVCPADSFDEGDGTVLGRLMFLQLHPHRQNRDLLNEKILDVIRTTNVLRSAQAKYR
ncbi:hypothetical protein TeGR_g12097 [Tetraparma gracilis]|uniref:Uncharacterized protein n=1 Tax=Tetraparma gracilis TaxID=2962635 RepID=A0ABQ6MK37_9STRA|nr:hypothetical protein TeGR_g12097 [Tetraparma gracilis]